MHHCHHKEPIIPWSFFDTEIGKAIVKIKYGQNANNIFFIKEIAKALGKTRQYLQQEIKAGNLTAHKRCGTLIIYTNDFEEYLKKRKIDTQDFYKKINLEIE
ncbi:MAG: hypothetical protein PHX70_07915 [Clostridium sp.]|nr:hypothetical protein [Clostridium sp.]